MSAKPIACRYGKNGYFGICLCPACNPIKSMSNSPDDPLELAADTLAMQLVGERHEKRDLVNLVRWLVLRRPSGLLSDELIPCYICGSLPGKPTVAKGFCSRCGNEP